MNILNEYDDCGTIYSLSDLLGRKGEGGMTIQPDYVKEELLHELSESFCMHNQLPPDLFTRYRIKRGLRNADGTGVLVGADRRPPDLSRI